MKRRDLFTLGAAAGFCLAGPRAIAQTRPAGSDLELIQLVDKSLLGHDIARDFAQGARSFLQDLQSRGRPARMSLRLVEVEGVAGASAGSLGAWLDSADAKAVLNTRPVVFGAYGDAVISRLLATPAFAQNGLLAVPITQDPRISRSPGVLAPYATIDQEIDEAIRALRNVYFMNRLTIVYAQAGLKSSLGAVVLDALKTHNLQATEIEEPVVNNLPRVAARVGATDTAAVLFLGGAPELATFVQSMGRSGTRRMVMGTSMVDARAAIELRVGTHGVGVMLTQPVPNPQRGRLPIVSEHLLAWNKFYDEQTTPMTLAGFMAMKWIVQSIGTAVASAEAIRRVSTGLDRSDAGLDIGGFTMRRQAAAKAYVELLFLREDGRLVS